MDAGPQGELFMVLTHVDKRIWVNIDKRSARALNTSGETAEFWNGGLVDKY